MNYDEIALYSGNSTPERYKAIVMMQIMLAWD